LLDLRRGKDRLEEILGNEFFPVFTPPWNRCSDATLTALVRLNFRAVSRSCGARPSAPPNLPEFPVQVDLHTRKESVGADPWDAMLGELQEGVADGCCGIMLHHRRMDDGAFEFLERLLPILVKNPRIELVNFSHLLTV
jgi:hypothetical protein